jgi:septum formation protein
VQVSGVDEQAIHHPDPRTLVQQLARAKAGAVLETLPTARPAAPAEASGPTPLAVLGCDSVLEFEGHAYGKPRDASEATARWRRMAGGWGELHTGHCLLRPGQDPLLAVVTTRVAFAPLAEEAIAAYVASGEPLRCAGGFALEGRGGMLIERLEGCFSNVIGLSLPLLRRWLFV